MGTEDPSISVVLATFNGERWIRAQASSIAAQALLPSEVIICDDASTDHTLRVAVDALAALGDRVRVLPSGQRRGVVANFERGIRAARGDIIALADQDDVWLAHKLSTIRDWAVTSRASGCFTDGWIIDALALKTGETLWERAHFSPRDRVAWRHDPLGVLLRKPVVTGATLAFRRQSITLLLPLPEDGWHDYSIAVLLAASAGIDALPTPTIDYRLHGSNTAGLPAPSRFDRVLPYADNRRGLVRQTRHFARLAERARAAGLPAEACNRLEAKTALLRKRALLPRPRYRRLPPVARGVVSREYHRYAQGFSSAVRDVAWR